jgi:acyl-CoA reductase-like NAD-dependent aldehyde dehydrogenase
MSAASVTAPEYLPFIGGEAVASTEHLILCAPYDGTPIAVVHQATTEMVDRAIAAARNAAPEMAGMTNFQRAELLDRVAQLLRRDRAEFASLLCAETGKPIREAQTEVDRAVQTTMASAGAARELRGEVIPIDAAPIGAGRMAFTIREPRGVIGIITPFNIPLNLALHKLGPALAGGNTVVHKPSEQTPLSAIRLAQTVKEAGAPVGAYNVVTGLGETIGAHLVSSPGIDMVTFTGSIEVGKAIRASAGLKPVTLELGGNSAVIIEPDADLDAAVPRIVQGGYGHSGQTCISVQRVYVHESIASTFLERLTSAVKALKIGPPQAETTDISSLIDEKAAKRVAGVIEEASAGGGRLLMGGGRKRATVAPAVLSDVPESTSFMQDELFGPAVAVNKYTDLDEAVQRVNGTRYGLQAGIYTHHLERAFQTARRLRVGGVLINDIPTFRADHMPYGGVKESGIGREGPLYAIHEMTDTKLIAWKV